MDRRQHLSEIAREHGILVVYAFGSRAADATRILNGEPVAGGGSDLDLAILLRTSPANPMLGFGGMYADFGELFDPLKVDLVFLHEVDPFIQEAAIRGVELICTDESRRDLFELDALRRAGDLLPIQRRLEIELFGTTNR